MLESTTSTVNWPTNSPFAFREIPVSAAESTPTNDDSSPCHNCLMEITMSRTTVNSKGRPTSYIMFSAYRVGRESMVPNQTSCSLHMSSALTLPSPASYAMPSSVDDEFSLSAASSLVNSIGMPECGLAKAPLFRLVDSSKPNITSNSSLLTATASTPKVLPTFPSPTVSGELSTGLALNAKVGIGVGISMAVLIMALATIFLCIRQRRHRAERMKLAKEALSDKPELTGEGTGYTEVNGVVSPRELNEQMRYEISCKPGDSLPHELDNGYQGTELSPD